MIKWQIWLGLFLLTVILTELLCFPAAVAGQSDENDVALNGTFRERVHLRLLEAGIDCISERKTVLPARVTAVKFDSRAAAEGVHVGDLILDLKPFADCVDLDIQRGEQRGKLHLKTTRQWGRGWRNPESPGAPEKIDETATIKARPLSDRVSAPMIEPMLLDISRTGSPPDYSLGSRARYPQESALALPSGSSDSGLALSVIDQQQILAKHEVVILIDKSGSMNTRDCQGGLSRWDWCREQTAALSEENEKFLPEGLTLVVFANDDDVFQHARVEDIAEIFRKYTPGGATNTGAALWGQLRTYLERKSKNPRTTKPVVIAIITDGEPTDGRTAAEAIISATSQLNDPCDLSIVFLQVGLDMGGAALLDELANNLVQEGARYDVVEHMTYQKLLHCGLRGALVSSILAPHLKPQVLGAGAADSDCFFEHLRSNLEKKWRKHHDVVRR